MTYPYLNSKFRTMLLSETCAMANRKQKQKTKYRALLFEWREEENFSLTLNKFLWFSWEMEIRCTRVQIRERGVVDQ